MPATSATRSSAPTPHERISLISLDAALDVQVVGQFNPAQLQYDESAGWSPSANQKADYPHLEFSASSPRTLSLELFFDTYEAEPGQRDVKARFVEPLGRLLRMIDPDAGDEALHRPPLVELRWGTGLSRFRGVLESMSTKLTMFLPDGTPVRATCALKLLEAAPDSFRRPGRR